MRTLFLLNPTAGKADCTRALPRQIDAAAARAGLAMGEYTIGSLPTQATPGSLPMPQPDRPGRQGSSPRLYGRRRWHLQ